MCIIYCVELVLIFEITVNIFIQFCVLCITPKIKGYAEHTAFWDTLHSFIFWKA